VVAVRAKSPADVAGVRIGDLIAEVNGVRVTEEAGSKILQSYSSSSYPPTTVRVDHIQGAVARVRSQECAACDIPYLRLVIIRDGERRPLTLYRKAR
jgi:S1-C subfamily serine protease